MSKTGEALFYIASAIVEAVKLAGNNGAPASLLYAAVMTQGITLQQFQPIMNCLVNIGCVRQDGFIYYHLNDLPAEMH